MKKVLSILVVVLALTIALGCFAYADEFAGEADYEVEAYGYALADALALDDGANFQVDNYAIDYVAPTCVATGWIRLHALVDGYVLNINGKNEETITDRYYRLYIDPTGEHVYSVLVVDKENNCLVNGSGHHVCEVCGKEQGDTCIIPADPSMHKYGDWIHELKPTCLNEGRDVRLCNVCGNREEKTIEANGHDKPEKFVFAEILAKAVTCDHSDTTGKQLWVCSKCMGKEVGIDKNGNPESEVRNYWLPHTWDSLEVVTPATCLDNGEGTHTCLVCGEDYATMDEDGDGNPDYGYEIIKAPGHVFLTLDFLAKDPSYTTYSGIIPDAPTCTEGSFVYWNCIGHADSPLDAFGNPLYDAMCPCAYDEPNLVEIDGVPDPSQNKEEDIIYEYLPPLGHDFGEWVCITAPGQSGNINGYWTRACKRPGCTAIEDFTGTQAEFDAMIAGKEAEEHAKLKNGLINEDGEWKYYVDDVFQSDFVGMVEQDGNDFFVADGKVCMDANGLNMYEGEWYFLSLGRVCKEHTGLALYDGCWFFITDGKLDTSVTGLVDYNGGTFVFADGRLIAEYSGLYFDGTDWYFAANGQIQKDFSGSVEYDGETFVLENGKLVG